MAKRPVRVGRDSPGGLDPGSFGRGGRALSMARWTEHMGAAGSGAKEVMVKISGGGRDADGVQAHFEYIDRHGNLPIETDHGETLQGKTAATELINEWGLDYGRIPGAPHSRQAAKNGARRPPRQAFNIVFSMPAGTPPEKVLRAVKKVAREEFAHQHRYAMALHAEQKEGHGKHPHVHLVVKAEHEYGGARLNPRKADLQRWREKFAEFLMELKVAATATRRQDRGLAKTAKKTSIYRATQRESKEGRAQELQTGAGDSTFMRRKLEAVRRELRSGTGARDDYTALLNVRTAVKNRYDAAIDWLRSQGREEEARRFELMQRRLPAVRTENQVIAESLRMRESDRTSHSPPGMMR